MSNSDELFMGLFITGFSAIGITVVWWCFRECKPSKMKKSPSMEVLQDPQIIV